VLRPDHVLARRSTREAFFWKRRSAALDDDDDDDRVEPTHGHRRGDDDDFRSGRALWERRARSGRDGTATARCGVAARLVAIIVGVRRRTRPRGGVSLVGW